MVTLFFSFEGQLSVCLPKRERSDVGGTFVAPMGPSLSRLSVRLGSPIKETTKMQGVKRILNNLIETTESIIQMNECGLDMNMMNDASYR